MFYFIMIFIKIFDPYIEFAFVIEFHQNILYEYCLTCTRYLSLPTKL